MDTETHFLFLAVVIYQIFEKFKDCRRNLKIGLNGKLHHRRYKICEINYAFEFKFDCCRDLKSIIE